MCNYSFANDRDAYVHSLRAYPTSIAGAQRQINADKKKGLSPRRDHFVEGQISIRSPKARNGLNMLHTSQRWQADRLSMPKKASQERFVDI